ncbi:hypothetical protein GLIP_1416 [Aliiglaciecola lipolytica E3]|uniref:Uncharacterized protein n=1 Tax=Aliiglaciecola lipolytica E3 TaxID=1127673 RepID=K6Y756_9ALTE|nr:hypothetical protein GLIP_1416 [Aliiglaciecola lipolytica E3]
MAKGFKLQLLSQEKCVEKLLKVFIKNGSFKATESQAIQVVELIGLVFTQSANYYALKGQNIHDETHLYKGLATILFAVLPYINLPAGELHHLQDAIATHSLVSRLGES